MHAPPPRARRIPFSAAAAGAVAALVVGALAWWGMHPPDVTSQIRRAQSLLEEARASRVMPADPRLGLPPIPEVDDIAQRKALFIAALLPGIVRENARIAEQRTRAQTVAEGSPAYAALAHAYGLGPDAPRAALLKRIDIVPASLALAQGAIESAWGTSRFAREGAAYFGMRTYDLNADGMAPAAPGPGATAFKVQSFPDATLSVRAYMKTLNTHPAYRALRETRAALRRAGERPTGLALAPDLRGYSEIGDAYVRLVTITIEANGLGAYNGLELR